MLGLNFGARGQNELEPLSSDKTIAFLGLTLLDTSLDRAYVGQDNELRRIGLLQEQVQVRFESEGFRFVGINAIQDELNSISNPAQCNGCEIDFAEKLGAGYVLVGEVHKVSNLILSINLVLREVVSKKIVRARVVDIRANTDESWTHGLRYILDNYFFPESSN